MTKRVKKNEKRDQVIDNEAEPLPLMKMKLSWKLEKNRETIEDFFEEILNLKTPVAPSVVPYESQTSCDSQESSQELEDETTSAIQFVEVQDDERVNIKINFTLKSEETSYVKNLPIFVRTYIGTRTSAFIDGLVDKNSGTVTMVYWYGEPKYIDTSQILQLNGNPFVHNDTRLVRKEEIIEWKLDHVYQTTNCSIMGLHSLTVSDLMRTICTLKISERKSEDFFLLRNKQKIPILETFEANQQIIKSEFILDFNQCLLKVPVIFCSCKTRQSSIWQVLKSYRSMEFVRQVSYCLDPNQITYLKTRSSFGNQKGSIEEFNKERLNQHRSLVERCSMVKELKSQPATGIVDAELKEFIAEAKPWYIQVGQIKIPVKLGQGSKAKTIATVSHRIDYLAQNPLDETMVKKWDKFYFLEWLPMTKENKHLLDAFKNDFQSCLTNGAPHIPNHFQKTQHLWIEDDALRSSFLSNKDVKLVRKVVKNQYKTIPWSKKFKKAMKGCDIQVKDVIRAIRLIKRKWERKFCCKMFIEWMDSENGTIHRVSILDSVQSNVDKKELVADFKKCVLKEIYKPKYFSLQQQLTLPPDKAFQSCDNVKLMNNGQIVPWRRSNGTELQTFNGAEIKVQDLVRSIKHFKGPERNINNFHLKWYDGNEERKDPISDSFDATMVDTFDCDNKDGNMMKIGKSFFKVHPENIPELQEQFKETLKSCMFEIKDHPFPATIWNTTKEDGIGFTMDEFVLECTTDGKTTGSDQAIHDLLVKPYHIIDQNNLNLLDRRFKLNCSIKIRGNLLSKITLKKNAIGKLLLEQDNITDEDLENAKFVKSLKNDQYHLCQSSLTSIPPLYFVKFPFLTKEIAEQLEQLNFCIPKTIQFLRSRMKLHECDYNELYHMSNDKCEIEGCRHCQSNENYLFIVGDRITPTKTKHYKIELFDVLIYNEKRNESWFLHVKDGIGTASIRECSSQVRVCHNKIKQWHKREDTTLQEIYKVIMEASTSIGVKEQYIHRVSAMDCLNKSFKNVEEFRRKIMSSTIYICLALADNTAMKWREFASFNVLSDLVFKAEEAKKSHPKQYEERLQEIAPNLDLKSDEIEGLLGWNNRSPCFTGDITKIETIHLHDHFNKNYRDDVKFCILPIPTSN